RLRGGGRDRRAGDHFQVVRIYEPLAAEAVRRAQIGAAGHLQPDLARSLDETAVPRGRAATGADRAVRARSLVRPDDDLAAVARGDRVRRDRCVLSEEGRGGITDACAFDRRAPRLAL